MTAREIIEKYNLIVKITKEDSRPDVLGDQFPNTSSHYRVMIARDAENHGLETAFETWYSTGPAIEELPTQEEIVGSVIRDILAYDNADDMADFLFEFGYATGNINSLRLGIKCFTYCCKASTQLGKMLGDSSNAGQNYLNLLAILQEFEDEE